MNKLHKSLLGMASLLALTAGQKSAEAALPPSDTGKTSATAGLQGYSAYADPMFELMKRTGGSFKAQVIEAALKDMLADPSPTQIEGAPALLDGLAGLGASSDLVEKSRKVLIELVSKATKIDDDLKEAAESKLREAPITSFKLAQASGHPRRPHKIERLRRPSHIEHLPTPPGEHLPTPPEIGQTGGGGAPYSDLRLKENIARVGQLESGLGLYRFNYTGSEQIYVGVMAQEVEAIMPAAVIYDAEGYRRVRYELLGMRMQTWKEWITCDQNAPTAGH